MGYNLHITRAEHFHESEQRPVTADEWLALVAGDPELRIVGDNGPYFADWSGPCSYPHGSWFNLRKGQIETKNPDRAILRKMLELASQLEAKVQGDDGELYTKAEDISSDEEMERLLNRVQKPKRPWWQFW